MAWGDKGEEYRPDKCTHGPDDGCEWCCERCNKDWHWCPKCGTVSNHKNEPCVPGIDPCDEPHDQDDGYESEMGFNPDATHPF